MRDGWSETPFSQALSSPVRNGVYKKKEFHGYGVKIVNMGELFANPRLGAIPMRRVHLSESEQGRFGVQKGDLLFARRSLVAEGAGKCCVVLETDEPTTFESSIIRARPDPAKSDSLFLYYYFNSPDGLHALDTIRRQVAVAGITGTDLSQLPVPHPTLEEQHAIAHVLGTLDDKIELNRRMNRNLEEMARAIFLDWFVDFGPTRAKMEGQEPYLPPELWDLFPDELVYSELGEIPEGWEIKPLGEIVELAYGKALKAGDRKGGTVPVYGSNGQVGWHDVKLVSGPGIIVGRKGNPGTVTWSHEDFFPIDTAFYVVPESPDPALHFLHYALIDQDLPSMAADSAVPGLNRNLAYMNDQLVPKRSLMEIYDSYVEKLFIRMHLLEKESHDLTLLRDTLLPRLLSGEIKIEEG